MTSLPPSAPPLLLTDVQVAAMAGLSRRSIWHLTSCGEFPAPIRLPGLRATRWRRADVEEWASNLEAGR